MDVPAAAGLSPAAERARRLPQQARALRRGARRVRPRRRDDAERARARAAAEARGGAGMSQRRHPPRASRRPAEPDRAAAPRLAGRARPATCCSNCSTIPVSSISTRKCWPTTRCSSPRSATASSALPRSSRRRATTPSSKACSSSRAEWRQGIGARWSQASRARSGGWERDAAACHRQPHVRRRSTEPSASSMIGEQRPAGPTSCRW